MTGNKINSLLHIRLKEIDSLESYPEKFKTIRKNELTNFAEKCKEIRKDLVESLKEQEIKTKDFHKMVRDRNWVIQRIFVKLTKRPFKIHNKSKEKIMEKFTNVFENQRGKG